MTLLRERMIEDMQLRGVSAGTQEACAYGVFRLARHDRKPPPDRRGGVPAVLPTPHAGRGLARSTVTIVLCGIEFFFEQTLYRKWMSLALMRPPRESKLPVVPGREEVRRVLGGMRIAASRTCRITIEPGGFSKKLDRTRL